MRCFRCDEQIDGDLRGEVRYAALPAGHSYESLKTLIVSCPHCQTILGTTIEPLALKSSIVKAMRT